MKTVLGAVVSMIEAITRWCGWLAALITAPLMIAMVWEVLSRYVFNKPTFWAYEIGYMMMGASLMLGIAYAVQAGAHVRVDFIYSALSPRLRALIDLVGFAFLLPMVLWMSLGLWDYFGSAFASGEVSGESAWNPVVWPFRLTFVAGFALFALQILAEILKSGWLLSHGVPLANKTAATEGRL